MCVFPETQLGYDSDEDDDIFADKKMKAKTKTKTPTKNAAINQPMAPVSIPEAFQVIGGDRYFKMKLPLLQFAYKDENIMDRYCSIVHMPSGCAEKGIVDYKIRAGMVQLIVNVTRLMVFHPYEYASQFRDEHNNPIYVDKDHVKIHGHFEAVKKMKGSSSSNRIFYVFEFQPSIMIEGDKVYEETYWDNGVLVKIPGFQLIKSTKGKHPQIFAHFEFKKKVDGHGFAQANSCEDLLEGDEDESSSEESNDSNDAADAPPFGFFGFGN